MLSRRALLRAAAALLALALGVGRDAWAQDDELDDGLRRPQRLTTGTANQLLGQLAPDGKELYFVSNRNTVNEIYRQDLEEARPKLVFDEGADVTWPRVSPDGKHLLYISFREQAAGALCVRDLPAAKRRRCLGDGGSALQAEWISPARIALVVRTSIQGDLRVLDVQVGRRLRARPLVDRNLTSPAVSPDGRWLVYVPVERYVERVGPGFAARAAPRLEALRLDRPGPPVPLALDLPGMTGQPAFAADGRSLYFAQFFNDSNQDGVIDAGDHAVLFRVPFDSRADDAPTRAAAATPVQLTDAARNCQYPAPGRALLVATCARGEELDIYGLPLDGEVPPAWGESQLTAAADLATRRVEELLLERHLLAHETAVTARRNVMMRLIRLHLQLDEFDAAAFYARHVGAARDRSTAGFTSVLTRLIEHRRAVHERERGRMAVDFEDEAHARLAKLRNPRWAPPAQALAAIVRSEIEDDLGDKQAARADLESVALAGVAVPAVLEAYYERADALYRELDDAEALAAACRRLATHPALPSDAQLLYARAAVRALVRGRPWDEADARLGRERAALPGDSELGFALDLGRALLAVRDDHPTDAVVDGLLALYHRQTRPGRRRALVLDAVERATALGADRISDAMAIAYIDDVKPGSDEYRRALRLYYRAMLGRAYRHLAAGRHAEARADFEAVARKTGSLEGWLEAFELAIRSHATPEELAAQVAALGSAIDEPTRHFLQAYLIDRRLPKLTGEAHARAVAQAIALLRAVWPALKRKREPQALFGALLHERFLTTGDMAAAQRANAHYLVALELVRRNPRYQAMVLGQLALLHTDVGNYRIALGYLDAREKLPYVDNGAGLAVRLAKARALLHVGKEAEAADVAEEALAMVGKKRWLEQFRVLALDRAALYNLAAGRFARALALYDAELPLVEARSGPAAARNRLVVRLARAAAALGDGQPRRALDDLAHVEPRLADRRLAKALVWPHATADEVVRSYRLITAGLRANAHRRLGELDAAQAALEERRALALQRLAHSDLDDHLRAVALVEARLADNARDRHDAAGAARYVAAALKHAYQLRKRTGAPVERAQLDALWLAAELRTETHVDLPFNLPRRLRHAYDRMVQQHDPAWRSYQRWFELYLTLLSPLHRGRHADGSDVLDPTQDTPGEATRRPPLRPFAARLRLSWR